MKATKEQKEEFRKIAEEIESLNGTINNYEEFKSLAEKMRALVAFIEVEE